MHIVEPISDAERTRFSTKAEAEAYLQAYAEWMKGDHQSPSPGTSLFGAVPKRIQGPPTRDASSGNVQTWYYMIDNPAYDEALWEVQTFYVHKVVGLPLPKKPAEVPASLSESPRLVPSGVLASRPLDEGLGVPVIWQTITHEPLSMSALPSHSP